MRIERAAYSSGTNKRPDSAHSGTSGTIEPETAAQQMAKPYPVPAVVHPRKGCGGQGCKAQTRTERPCAAFVAQLIAGKLHLPATRSRRRESPRMAQDAYAQSQIRVSALRQETSGGTTL